MSFDGHFLNSHGVIHEQEGNGSTELWARVAELSSLPCVRAA